MTTDKAVAYWIIDGLVQSGVSALICSPGSRNAPLVIAADAHDGIQVRTVLDERSAAFQAIGHALVTGCPVALCCTSGSAIANYQPGILEAYYSKVPVIAITADRPQERIGKGEGQTVVQRDFFAPEIGASLHLNDSDSKELVSQELIKVLSHTTQSSEPVHINISFTEPLYQLQEVHEKIKLEWDEPLIAGTAPVVLTQGKTALVCGQLRPEQARKILDNKWIEQTNGTWFVDPLSGLLHHPKTRHVQELTKESATDILSVGGQLIDKHPKFHLRSLGINRHIHIDPHQHWDIADAQEFLQVRRFLDFQVDIQPIQFITSKDSSTPFEAPLQWSDAAVVQSLANHVSESDVLHIGNSSAPRYFGYFACVAKLYSNRGTAGIDGSLSTAVGAALARPKERHYALLGDQSFLYDSNALFTQGFPQNLTIVVLNNGVGGIFDWLPGTKNVSASAKSVFEHKQTVNLSLLSASFGLQHRKTSSTQDLLKSLENKAQGALLIECVTEQDNNLKAYARLGTLYL